MKKNILRARLLAAIMLCIVFTGCEKNKTCTEEYAPEGTSVSWTEYNNVMIFRKYFKCHPSTIKQHADAQDTIKVTGWVFLMDENTRWDSAWFVHHDENAFDLTANADHSGYDRCTQIEVSQDILDEFRANFHAYYPKQLYITGTIAYSDYAGITGCCYRNERVVATIIDTMP